MIAFGVSTSESKVFVASKPRVFDSGSDEHLRGVLSHGDTTFKGEPIALDTVKGLCMTQDKVEVDLGSKLGADEAYYVQGSVDVDSMGRVVARKNAYLWDTEHFDEPLLLDSTAARQELDALRDKAQQHKTAEVTVQGYVPMLAAAAQHDE